MLAIEPYLAALRDGDALALHLRAGEPPYWRVGADLLPNGDPLPHGPAFDAMLDELLAVARSGSDPADADVEFAFEQGGCRFVCRIFAGRGGRHAVLRRVAVEVAAPDELRLPGPLVSALSHRSGLILVCGGGPGTGLSTTIASLVRSINTGQHRYVIHIEDPIELRTPAGQSFVHAIEVGVDTPSFAVALRTAISARADVVVVGRLEGAEATRLALVAADRGALVIAGVRASGAVDGIERILDAFPEEDAEYLRTVLAQSLRLSVCQQLVPGRVRDAVLVAEIVPATEAVRAAVRDGRLEDVDALLLDTRARSTGVRSADDALEALLAAEEIDRACAARHARNRSRFEK